jgi:uncharacterized membrane protein (DUF4010 family)
MGIDALDRPEWRMAVALAIGLVIGAERERRLAEDRNQHQAAGVRTFALTALFGAVLMQLDQPGVLVGGLIVIAALVGISYVVSAHADPGITSEVALLLTFGLGALAQREPRLALSAGIVTAFLLVIRAKLHAVVREVIRETEMLDAITFAAAAIVILPMLPDESIDPWGAINPFVLWRLVVIMMAITSAGYMALRWIGPRYGLAVTGLASGFVSSSATIGAMGARAKEQGGLLPAAVAGAAASTVATFAQLAMLIGVASPELLRAVAAPLIGGGGAAALFALVMALRARRAPIPDGIEHGRPFRWKPILAFVAVVGAVTLISVLLRAQVGASGALLGAVAGALADVHASASALSAMHATHSIDTAGATLALLAAISTNSVTKIVFAISAGPRRYWLQVVAGVLIALGASWAGMLVAT